MRFFRHLFMLLMMLSMAILLGHANAMSCARDCEHELHAHQAHMHARHAEMGLSHDAEAGIQASTHSEHHEHCALDHGGNCCVTCTPGFTPAESNIQVGLLSRSWALPIPVADAQREDALLCATFRPPIFG